MVDLMLAPGPLPNWLLVLQTWLQVRVGHTSRRSLYLMPAPPQVSDVSSPCFAQANSSVDSSPAQERAPSAPSSEHRVLSNTEARLHSEVLPVY